MKMIKKPNFKLLSCCLAACPGTSLNKMSNKTREDSGYTLVEVMVAVLLALIIMGGVYQTLTRETVDMEREEIILDMQNNARVAMNKIAQEVRRAGFFGCGGDGEFLAGNAGTDSTRVETLTSALDNNITDTWNAKHPLLNGLKANAGVRYLGAPLGIYNNASAPNTLYDPGTDAITLVYLGGDHAQVGTMASQTADINIPTGDFNQGDLIVITDCRDFSLFQKTNADNTTNIAHTTTAIPYKHNDLTPDPTFANSSASLKKSYGVELQARVFHLRTSTFFINGSDLKYSSSDLNNGLDDLTVASNIEDLQFELLFDLNDNDDLSDDAWSTGIPGGFSASDARAVRIWILAMSERVSGSENFFDSYDTGTFAYPSSKYPAGSPPNDNRYRYLASRTVYLRNAGI